MLSKQMAEHLNILNMADEAREPIYYDGTYYCAECKSPVLETDKFCHECGRPIGTKKEFVPDAHCLSFFHGEEWYKCPHCGVAFEICTAWNESKGYKKDGEIYTCGHCGKKFRIH